MEAATRRAFFGCCLVWSAGCASQAESATDARGRGLPIAFPELYSAYDGMHEYRLTPFIPSADPDSEASDPVVAASVRWTVDGQYLTQQDFDALPGGVLLTTKKVGETVVRVTAKTQSGRERQGEAKVVISEARMDEWEAGEARFNLQERIWPNAPAQSDPEALGPCENPREITREWPSSMGCVHCHGETATIGRLPTPTQTAGYYNEQFVKIFSEGEEPPGGLWNSPYLQELPMPECTYSAFHTWALTDAEKLGLIWKLRSIAPAVHAE